MDYLAFTREELLKELTLAQKELDAMKKHNRTQADSDATLLSILNSLPDMILKVDTDMTVVWANKAALDKSPQVIGRKCYEAYLGYNEPCENCPCVQALRTGQIVEGTMALPSGKDSDDTAHWENIGIPVFDSSGRVNGMIEISKNVSDRVYFEKKLSEYTQALEDSKRMSDKSSEVKSEFITNLSHELRTPMNGLMGMVQLLENTDLSPMQQEYLDVISASSRKMMNVLTNVIESATLEQGHMVLRHDPFDIRWVFDELVKVYSKHAHEKGLRFTTRFDPSIPDKLLGDVKRLRQALLNIITNAIKFTDSGRVEFSMDVVNESSKTVELLISVKDSGIGISESQRETILKGLVEEGAGFESSGIGLAISKQIVNLMGGNLELVSELYKGTEVNISLTFERMQEVIVEEKKPARKERGQDEKLRVLVAEDEVIGRVTMKLMLKDKYDVSFAKNGREAVDMYFDIEPDIVLMDILMPEMNGFEAFDEIEKRSLSRSPIIACTAKVISTEKEYLTSYGFDDYLSKPIDVQQLKQLLDKYMR